MRNYFLFSVLMALSSGVWAWSAMYLDGQNWAIICADGTAHSYHGSSAGLDTVGPALCPNGAAGPGGPSGPTWTVEKVEKEILSSSGDKPHPRPKPLDKATPALSR